VALDGYGYYTFAVRGTGGVAVWGGAGGYGVTLVGADAPVPAATQLLGIRQIDGGNEFACAVTTAGSVYCWGYGSAGQLGDGQYLTRNSPVRVSGITNAVHVSAGNSHACAVLATGAVMCWGTNG